MASRYCLNKDTRLRDVSVNGMVNLRMNVEAEVWRNYIYDRIQELSSSSSGCLTVSWSVWSHAVTPHSIIYHIVFVI